MGKLTALFVLILMVVPGTAKGESAPREIPQVEEVAQSEEEFLKQRIAAELGDANAMFAMGEMYFYGEGVAEDVNMALEWFLKAAEAGSADAMYELGDKYYWGEGVSEDTNKAIIWYTKAADAGYSEAMYKLGDMYYYGWGIREDSTKAEEWYIKAIRSYQMDAEAGDSDAMQKVAEMYERGEGVTKDYRQALQWYSEAAKAGNSLAMYRIGLMYEIGKGVDKDYEQAKVWYKEAIEQGENEAKIRISIIFLKKYYKIALWAFLVIVVFGGVVYATKKKPIEEEEAGICEVDSEAKEWTMWVTLRRYVGSLFIYLVYWLTLWGAIRRAVPATLSYDKATEQIEAGIIESVWEYGWGDHYILFLIAFCVVTYTCAVLAGATAKKKGALVASIANLPIIIFMSLITWFFYTAAENIDGLSPIAWKIVLPTSVLGSIFLCIVGGSAGQRWQNGAFRSNTIFGIRAYHWWWLIFPLNLVILELVPKIVGTLVLLVGGASMRETKYGVLFFLMFVVSATFIYFIVWGWYKALCLLSTSRRIKLRRWRTALRVLFYLFGIPLLCDVLSILIYIAIKRGF